MNKRVQAIDFIEDFMRWSTRRKDVRAAALVGSYARNAAMASSGVDLLIITEEPQRYLTSTNWTRVFGVVITKEIEEQGNLASLHVWYENGLEIDFGFTTREGIRSLTREESKQIKADGLRLLFEKENLLSHHETPVNKQI